MPTGEGDLVGPGCKAVPVLFAEVAATSEAVAAAAARRDKTALLAARLRQAGPGDAAVLAAWLSGQTRQRRTGLGWTSLRDMPPPATTANLTVTEVDDALARAATLAGPGSSTARHAVLAGLLSASTAPEQRFLAGLVSGEVRQGAQASVLLDALAAAAAVPVADVRRALAVHADLPDVAEAALAGGAEALDAFRLRVGQPLAPMLAGSAPDLDAALAKTGPAALEWKLDGVRVQLHKDGDAVRLFTRTLDEITPRLPEVVARVRALPIRTAILDGEVLAYRPDGRPAPFQVTAARVARRELDGDGSATSVELTVFDALHLDGRDLIDEPAADRRAALDGALVPGCGELLVPRHVVQDPADLDQLEGARAFQADALARGHEGLVVKALDSGYSMGRRGAGWVKVKPRITLDLVVIGVEWGHGRRAGWLSNLHLGARDPDGKFGPPGGFVMLGKTFKGLTDAMLTWQTERLQELALDAGGWQVQVRPELVVEIAFDGVQGSPRYPAGVALRFARVLAHRPDKPAREADTIDTVLGHLPA
jgi:DNA ligase-1